MDLGLGLTTVFGGLTAAPALLDTLVPVVAATTMLAAGTKLAASPRAKTAGLGF